MPNNEYVQLFVFRVLLTLYIRFMLMDPRVWGDAEKFRPERFLEAGADSLPNPLTVIFGYGMR